MNSYEASGTFEVSILPEPLPDSDPIDGTARGRMTLHKRFIGDLVGISHGSMLTAMGHPPTSAVYVAIEQFSGTLQGRVGSFMMAHYGERTPSNESLRISVTPGSGTGQLVGISGVMSLRIEGGVHHWTLNYSLPDA